MDWPNLGNSAYIRFKTAPMHQKMAEDARKRLAAVLGGDANGAAVDQAAVPLLRDSVAGAFAFPVRCLIAWKFDVL